MTTHFVDDTSVLLGRSLRHVTRSLDTIITATIMPIALMLLFVYVFGGAIDTGSGALRELPAARHPAHHRSRWASPTPRSGSSRTAERDLRALPVHADRPVERAVGARADLGGLQPDLASRSSCSSPC